MVERDAFITTYLNKIKVPRIDLEKIKNPIIRLVLNSGRRYNLELFVFEITNDLEIPTFMSILIDKTGIGPGISLGLKSDFNLLEGILGSIRESFMGRIFQRSEIFKRKANEFEIKGEEIKTLKERSLFWLHPKMINKLSYLLTIPKTSIKISDPPNNNLLSIILEVFKRKGIEVFFADMTSSFARKSGYLVYKVLIPSLQPLYLNEKYREIRVHRLKTTAQYFGQDYYINPIPHPFL